MAELSRKNDQRSRYRTFKDFCTFFLGRGGIAHFFVWILKLMKFTRFFYLFEGVEYKSLY
jgi:hypothetical protein